jgi:hypothetical protein
MDKNVSLVQYIGILERYELQGCCKFYDCVSRTSGFGLLLAQCC